MIITYGDYKRTKMKFFKRDELKLLWPFYLVIFISAALYIYPAFYIIQLQETLTLAQIGLLIAAIGLSSFIFEIPTGVIADIYGRKFSVLIGYFVQALLIIGISLFSNFYILLIIFFLWGVFGTFITGAYDAWVTDNLIYKNKKKLVEDYYIKEYSIGSIGFVVAGLIGTLIVKLFGINIIWVVTGLSYILAGLILVFMAEHKITKESKGDFKTLFNHTKISAKYSYNDKRVLYFLIASFFVACFMVFTGNIISQPFLKNLGFPVYYFGLFYSAITIIGIFTPYLVKPIGKKIGKDNLFLSFMLFLQIVVVSLVMFVNKIFLGVILLVLLSFAQDLYSPVRNSYFQKLIPSKMRATLGSFRGMLVAFAFILVAPLVGYLGDALGPKVVILLGGIFLIPAIIFYLKIKNDKGFIK